MTIYKPSKEVRDRPFLHGLQKELTLLALDSLNLDFQPPELGDSRCLWSKPPCTALCCRSPRTLTRLSLGKNAFLLNLKISIYNLTPVSLGK